MRDEPTRDLDVWVVLTCGEECGMEGMRAFIRSHREELEPASTFVVALDSIGAGTPRWATAEGMTVSFAMDRHLVELCEAIAAADADDGGRFDAAPLRRGLQTDALAAAVRGLRATAILSLVDPDNLEVSLSLPEALGPFATDGETLHGVVSPSGAAFTAKVRVSGVVVDMLLTGEETGSLERVADQIAATYEEEIDIAVDGLTETITPAFVVVMGLIVLSIVLGIFLPLISMIETISSGAL